MTDRGSEHRDEIIAQTLAEMELPEESPSFFAELRARAVGERERPSRRGFRTFAARRPVALVVITALLFALLGGAAGSIAAAAAGRSGTEAEPAVLAFAPAEGWNTLQTRDDQDLRVQFAWASNVPFAGDDSVSGQPIHTAKSLPPNGIVVYVSSLPDVPDASGYRDVQLPIRLSQGEFFTGQYENQPAPNVSKYQINAHVNGQYVYAEVMLGTPQPSTELLNAAEAQLGRLLVPKR